MLFITRRQESASIFGTLQNIVYGGSRDIHCYIICGNIPGKIRTIFTGNVMFSQVSIVSPLFKVVADISDNGNNSRTT